MNGCIVPDACGGNGMCCYSVSRMPAAAGLMITAREGC
jgi:hypothetical protein